MTTVLISPDEKAIIEDIREIAYGEIYSVEAKRGTNLIKVTLTPKEANLVHAMRSYKELTRIVVHDNEPSYAEIDGLTPSGRQCKKKVRF